jgi:nucleotide-binding universal stress UspA family protein
MYKNVLIALNDSQAAERALHRAMAMAELEKGDLFVVVVNEGVPEGKPVNSILEAVHQVQADLLVFGITPHFGLGSVIFGSTAIELVRQARCDVLGVH